MGLDWQMEDLVEFSKELQADGELSEEDLENVAGGVVTATVGVAAGVVGAGAAVASTTTGSGW
jgi:lactobin A/cerein 7B family class IIb bacteriocin